MKYQVAKVVLLTMSPSSQKHHNRLHQSRRAKTKSQGSIQEALHKFFMHTHKKKEMKYWTKPSMEEWIFKRLESGGLDKSIGHS